MMENKNFDEEFKNRIKQVFEEQDDGAANAGWDLLREKYPEKKRRDGLFWWIFAAALLLIALVFGLFQAYFDQQKTSKIVNPHQTDTALANRYSSTQKTITNKITADTINTKKTSIKKASDFAESNLLETNNMVKNQVSIDTLNTKKTLIKIVSNFSSTLKLQPKTITENQNNTAFTSIKIDSVETTIQQNLIKFPTDYATQKALVATTKNTNPIVAKTVLKKHVEDKIPKKVTKKSVRFSLAVYAGSHVNYASGSNNQLGLGAGFSTDFRLSKKFKLSTGLGLMQNNLTYNQDISSASLNAANGNYSTIPALGTSSQYAILSSFNTRLLALDIPVNLVYNFFVGKNSISVSGGISSNTFVREAYDYHYSNLTNTTQNVKSFNNFNFAKTLNLAAGFAYPLGKNQLQIEPFLKYPLGGTGSQQLKFGSAGINLKMNIRSFKK